MDKEYILKLLNKYKNNRISIEKCYSHLSELPFKELKHACLDNWRATRKGFPEVVYSANKSYKQLSSIIKELLKVNSKILLTRVSEVNAGKLIKKYKKANYNPDAGTITFGTSRVISNCEVVIVTAGTSDIYVAEEAAETLKISGIKFIKLYDIGIAGIHRLMDKIDIINNASIAIVIAGMEGMLPGIVCGLADTPVIAVPTSIGYGTNLGGIAPLLTMLNSCASGITVANIDNGFGAAYFAASMCRKIEKNNE